MDLKAACPIPEPYPTEGALSDCPDVQSSGNDCTCPDCPKCLTLDVKTACSMCQSAICPKCESSVCPKYECPTQAPSTSECPKSNCSAQAPCSECPQCNCPPQVPWPERDFFKPLERGTSDQEARNLHQNEISCPECDISKANNLIDSETNKIIGTTESNETISGAHPENKDYNNNNQLHINNDGFLINGANIFNSQNMDKPAVLVETIDTDVQSHQGSSNGEINNIKPGEKSDIAGIDHTMSYS